MAAPRRLLIYGPLMPDLARGVAAGIEAMGTWDVVTRSLDAGCHSDLPHVDAVLCYVSQGGGPAIFPGFVGPVLNFSGVLDPSPFPLITWDNTATGQLAAAYFLERHYEQFAFVGYDEAGFSRDRQVGFTAALADQAHSCAVTALGPFHRPAQLLTARQLAAWLETLPRPLAVFAANDQAARRVAEAATLINRAIPEDLAILGCDDSPDALLAPVTISTVVPPLHDIGFHAIRLLSAALAGESLPADTRVAPKIIIDRASTATDAIVSQRVAAAVGWIRGNFHQRISVDDVAAALALSRRALEIAFAKSHVRSVKGEIEHQRVELARRLLGNPEMTLTAIARRCGFRDRQRFSVVFKRLTGQTPGASRG